MIDKLSIEQANPFLDSTNVVQSIFDVQHFHSKVEYKSEKGTIVVLPNNDTGLLPVCGSGDNNEFEIGYDIDIIYEVNGQVIKDNSRLKVYQNVLTKAKEGQILKAIVTAPTEQGLLVTVEGLECFMPKGQIGFEKNEDLHTYVGQTMEVKLISVKLKEMEGNRFLPIVSHKILEDDNNVIKAQEKLRDIEVGSIVRGTVKSVVSYGVFVSLFPSIDGLIHITDLSWERVSDPSSILSVGQNVTVVVLDIKRTNDGKIKISLGLKQLSQRPWERFDKNFKEGDVVSGSICNITDYGIFIKLSSGVQGLVHRSELSWDSKVTYRDFTKGQNVSAKIINIDWDNEKLALSIKQLVADPWANIEEKISIGDVIETTIVKFTGSGVFVALTDGIEGLIHVSELSWTKKIKKPEDYYSLGEHLNAVIISIDKDKRKIELSHKQILPNPWKYYAVGQQVNVIVTEMEEQGIKVKLEKDNLPAYIPAKFVPNDLVLEENCKLVCNIQEIDENKRRIILAMD